MQPTNRRNERIVTIAALGLLVVGLFALFNFYNGEGENRAANLTIGDQTDPDRVDVTATLLSVDQQKGDAVLRLAFAPKGALVKPEGFLLAKDLKLFVNSATGGEERSFSKGKPMSPTDVTLAMYNGRVTDYPFDEFETNLELGVSTPGADGAATVVPLSTHIFGSLHGLRVEVSADSTHAVGYTDIVLKLARSGTTIALAVAVMTLLWLMALGILLVTIAVIFGSRKLELPILALCGALIFGFTALRNALPGTPPLGSLSDYLSFFWAEGLLAFCLIVLMGIYLFRPAPK